MVKPKGTSGGDDGAWFAAKRYGLGAGLPIAWQGWAVLLSAIAIIVGVGILLDGRPALQAAIVLPVVAVLALVTAFKTRGGWRWRWGDSE